MAEVEILDYLGRRNSASNEEIARDLHYSKSHVHNTCIRLESEGRLLRYTEGSTGRCGRRSVRWYVNYAWYLQGDTQNKRAG